MACYYVMICYCTLSPALVSVSNIGTLKLATAGVFTPQKLADTTNQDLNS